MQQTSEPELDMVGMLELPLKQNYDSYAKDFNGKRQHKRIDE